MPQTWLRAPRWIGPRRSDDQPVGDRAQMVGVDLLPEAAEFRGVDDEIRGDAAQCLRQRDGGAPVQITQRLMRARLDRHGAAQEIVAELGEFDAEMRAT